MVGVLSIGGTLESQALHLEFPGPDVSEAVARAWFGLAKRGRWRHKVPKEAAQRFDNKNLKGPQMVIINLGSQRANPFVRRPDSLDIGMSRLEPFMTRSFHAFVVGNMKHLPIGPPVKQCALTLILP